MSREEMILALTRYELDWYVDNFDGHEDTMAEFFAKGGFNTYSDDKLRDLYFLRFENENERVKRRNVAGHIVEPPNRDEWVNWKEKV